MNRREMSEAFSALGDEKRLFILQLILQRELNAGQLLEIVKGAQSTLSHHMKILTDSKIVIARRAGKHTWYRVNEERAEQMSELLLRFKEVLQQLPAVRPGEDDSAEIKISASVPEKSVKKKKKTGKPEKTAKATEFDFAEEPEKQVITEEPELPEDLQGEEIWPEEPEIQEKPEKQEEPEKVKQPGEPEGKKKKKKDLKKTKEKDRPKKPDKEKKKKDKKKDKSSKSRK